MHFDQIIEEPFLGVEEKRRRQGVALVCGKPPELWDVVGLHSSAQTLEKFRADARVLERCEVEGAELIIPLQIGHDVLGFGFRWIGGKAGEVGRILWIRRDSRATTLTC
jgi:hypothetical protein